jgi:hypothetical protein
MSARKWPIACFPNAVRLLQFLVSIVALGMTPGCATVFGGITQTVTIETRDDEALLPGCACSLQNGKGTWTMMAPGSVAIDRSFSDLGVICTHEGYGPAGRIIKSSIGAWMLGNVIMIGGLIGAAIDVDSGAAFDYPIFITVDFGRARGDPLSY